MHRNKSQRRNKPQLIGKAWEDNSALNRSPGLASSTGTSCLGNLPYLYNWSRGSQAAAEDIIQNREEKNQNAFINNVLKPWTAGCTIFTQLLGKFFRCLFLNPVLLI